MKKAFGTAVTNCYIVKGKNSSIIIDPGVDAFNWAYENAINLAGVFLTHGHWDHAYCAKFFSDKGYSVYIHRDDSFMVENASSMMPNAFKPEILTSDASEFKVGEFGVKFHHFPGHTPGCCMLEVSCEDEKFMFSGDFLFKGSVGRWDFPYSDADKMRKSLQKALKIKENFTLYPGHGFYTTFEDERATIEYFLRVI
ncbi:MBL fold metallo-hydrolase [Campylobacter corcagiensis]|nr:MBL fold metallo-hydrolase [Campylobacter corcagiensis]QKF64863.1 metallo-beta-lactamase family protein [Campylobacter corcagiensis]